MIESKYVKKITCDACGFSIETHCDEDSMTALSENAIDWMNIRFDRLDTTEYTYKHLCPDCAKKFLALFENSEDMEKEESDNIDADGNEQRCSKCFYFKSMRIDSTFGHCEKDDRYVYDHMHCGAFSGM